MKVRSPITHQTGSFRFLGVLVLAVSAAGCRQRPEEPPASSAPVSSPAVTSAETSLSPSGVVHLGANLAQWRCPLESAPLSELLDASWEPVPELDTEAMSVFRAPLREPVLSHPGSAGLALSPPDPDAPADLELAPLARLAPGAFALLPAQEKRVPFQVALTSAGSAVCDVVLPAGTTAVTVFARGKEALGVPPEMRLIWNGAEIAVHHVAAGRVAPYTAPAPAKSATNTLEIAFTNDFWREGGEDRNLYLERIQFAQPAYVYQGVAADAESPVAPRPVLASYIPRSATLEAYQAAEPVPGVAAFGPPSGYYSIGGETLPAIPVPARGFAAFECRVPPSPVLELAFAVAPASRREGCDGVFFLVSVAVARVATPVLELFLDPAHYPEHRAWVRRNLDLAPFAGMDADVVVETFPYYPLPLEAERRGTADADWALVAEPVLRSRSRTSDRNVILVSLDTLRADHLGCYGYHRNTSPHLDALSGECFLFENVMSQANWTVPAHISMLASLYTSTHGITSPRTALREAVTLAGVLRREGYLTHAVVDGGFMAAQFGLFHGFDSYRSLEQVGLRDVLPAAREWLRDRAEGPFFLFLHTYDVHAPYAAPPEFQAFFPPPPGSTPELVRRIRGTFINEHDSIEENLRNPVSPVELEQVVNLYDASIRYADHLLGGFLSYLDHTGVLDRSLLVITSDHGEGMMDHGLLNHGNSYYQELLWVPLLIRLPGGGKGARPAQLVELVDLPPTVAEWALGRVPPEFQGRSLLPALEGKPLPDRPGFAEGRASDRYAGAVRTGDMKLIRMGADPPELYDLKYDPAERVNLAPGEPRLVDRLTAEAEAFRERNRRRAPEDVTQDAGVTDEQLEGLRRLGYF